MFKLTLIFLGSGLGGVLRFGVSELVHAWWRGAFPMGTLVVNVTGCVAIGFLVVAMGGPLVRDEQRAALLIGLLGGYTTFSAFGRETLALMQDGRPGAALLNVALSNALGLAGVWLGWMLATRIHGPHMA